MSERQIHYTVQLGLLVAMVASNAIEIRALCLVGLFVDGLLCAMRAMSKARRRSTEYGKAYAELIESLKATYENSDRDWFEIVNGRRVQSETLKH